MAAAPCSGVSRTSRGGRNGTTRAGRIRFAESLDDYEHVTVTDIGGQGPDGYWLVVRDHRFDTEYDISSHCDYWDFIAALVDHKQYIGRVVEREVA